ncbi:MAG: DNA repair protein RecO [Magnetococcales bacterium]|nr:DNA repair protein RecO [Magnetococcales bacterium]
MRWSDDALVLRRTPFRETSLLLHFFSRRHGLLSALARGVRAGGRAAASMDRAALAGFHTVVMGCQARSVQALATLTAVEIKQPRHRLMHGAAALLAAQVIQEALYRFMAPGEPNPGVFELLEWAWDQLDGAQEPLAVLGICQARLVRALGYGWRTDCCVGCGGQEGLRYFSAKRGQVVCNRCAAPYVQPILTAEAAQAGPWLFFLGDHLYAILQQLEWTPGFVALSVADKAVLYRIGMACLVWLGRTPLLSDAPFRQILGLESIHSYATSSS